MVIIILEDMIYQIKINKNVKNYVKINKHIN